VKDIKHKARPSPEENISSNITDEEKIRITRAVDVAINNYIKSRREKIPSFVNQHFSFKGSLSLHRKAIGRDLYRAPLNVAWAFPYTISRLLTGSLKAIGNKRTTKVIEVLEKIPRGFETDIQKEVKWLIYTELLELPYSHYSKVNKKSKTSEHDALLNEILVQPDIRDIITLQLTQIHEKSLVPDFRSSLERKLREYTYSRTAAEDLSGSILTLALGYVAFHTFSPGAISSGLALATSIAQKLATSSFWLGSSIGTRYYGMFPITPSKKLFLVSTASIMAALAIITTFSGVLTDPLQSRLGIHQKRLQKFISSLEEDLKAKQNKEYQIKDQYVVRIFDIIDLLKAAALA